MTAYPLMISRVVVQQAAWRTAGSTQQLLVLTHCQWVMLVGALVQACQLPAARLLLVQLTVTLPPVILVAGSDMQ